MSFDDLVKSLAITNTPFNDEYLNVLALSKSDYDDAVVQNYRIPLFNSFIDIQQLFEAYGNHPHYALACTELILAYYHSALLDFTRRINQNNNMISNQEIKRLYVKNQKSTSIPTTIRDIILPTNIPYSEINDQYIKPQLKHYEKIIDELKAYKSSLISTNQSLFDVPAFIEKVQEDIRLNRVSIANKALFLQSDGNATKFGLINYVPGYNPAHYLFERKLLEDTRIPSVEDRINLSHRLMEYRVSLQADLQHQTITQETLQAYDAHMAEVHASITRSFDELNVKCPAAPLWASRTTKLYGVALFKDDRSQRCKVLRSIERLENFALPAEHEKALAHPLQSLVQSIRDNLGQHQVLAESTLIPLYIDYISKELHIALGHADYQTSEAERNAILTHPHYPLISSMSHAHTNAILKKALLVGLGVTLLSSIVVLSLVLAPTTTHLMTDLAASFAKNVSGLMCLGALTIVMPAVVSAGSTAAVLRYRLPASMPHENSTSAISLRSWIMV